MEKEKLTQLVCRVLDQMNGENAAGRFPVEMSARHVHLCQADIRTLFGENGALTLKKELSLPGAYLSEQRVTLVTERGVFKNVAVLGPAREATQVELSATDAFQMGIDAPCRISGDLTGAGDVYIIGSHGAIYAEKNCIVAQAHIHMNAEEAAGYHVGDRELVEVELLTDRPVVLKNVMIRVASQWHATMHIDMDEANACHRTDATMGILRKIIKG